MKASARWSEEEFGKVALGDIRRTRRLVRMVAELAERPSGTVSAVFAEQKGREGAYDFLENGRVTSAALADGMFAATVKRASGCPYVYVAIDGTSLTLPDRAAKRKGFGPINTRSNKARGLMVNSALAITPDGVTLGIVDQKFWSRPPTLKLTQSQAVMRNQARAFDDKEPSEMLRSAKRAVTRLATEGVKAWVVIDRAADDQGILEGLVETECFFCVRVKYNRYLNEEDRLRSVLGAEPVIGTYEVEVGRTAKRPARTAKMELRSKRVNVPIRRRQKNERTLGLTAIWVREYGVDKEPLDWIVYTNVEVTGFEDGKRIVEAYRTRWRIEEFHRTWKEGHCNVEDAKLQSREAMEKWATMLAAVATRIERLKYAARRQPDQPAVLFLSPIELEVLQLFHRKSRAKPPAAVSVEQITVKDATSWIASMGGWMGKSHGLPGSVTLMRGLEKLEQLVVGFEVARSLQTVPGT